MTRDLYSLNLFAKLMMLHCQILFSLAIAAVAEVILIRTSAEQVPFLQGATYSQLLETGHLL